MKHSRHSQRGMTIVELMVGLTIGLVISLAAAAMYMAVNENSRSLKANADIDETGKLALDAIGREIQKAGFFPAYVASLTNSSIAGSFYNGKAGAKPAFNNGLYGCDGARYNPSTKECDATVVGAPDSIVINYFSTLEFGANSLYGNANDCNRKPASSDPDNAARAAAAQPLFVSNRFGLTAPATYIDARKNSITTRSLGCHGNGNDAAANMESHYNGIDEMVIRYGIYPDPVTELQSPTEFLTADGVKAKASVGGVSNWRRVSAVKICVVVHTLENSRLEDKTGSLKTYKNCQGNDVTPPAGNRYLYKSFERIFAVRSNLNKIKDI
jgi:type IV pilus assembly protein PilW